MDIYAEFIQVFLANFPGQFQDEILTVNDIRTTKIEDEICIFQLSTHKPKTNISLKVGQAIRIQQCFFKCPKQNGLALHAL